jgi:tripartite-type tricarboxylate transporter receptor subunit TctC
MHINLSEQRAVTKRLLLVVFTLFGVFSPAYALDYPSRPITFVVPFAAGGPTDTLGRTIIERMSRILGQSIVIENVVGAGGSIGVRRVVHAPPDGYTISLGNWSTHVLNGGIYSLDYDLIDDLEPVALLPSAPQLIVARNDIKASNLAELIAWIKENRVTLGTAGVGSAGHISAIQFQKLTGTKLTLVHYRGGGPAMTDLIGGHIDMMIDQSNTSLPQVRDGKIRPIAVTSQTRLASAPTIPTTEEAGLPNFQVAVWHGLWAPKGTPTDVISRLSAAAREALSNPTVRERLQSLGQYIPAPDQISPAGLKDLQQAEIKKWWPILKTAGIKAE